MKEVPYVSIPPTHILSVTRGSVTVVTRLYGVVTPERVIAETLAATHRADQLS